MGSSASACISDVMDRNTSAHPEPTIFNGEVVSNLGFVDDTATMDTTVKGVKASCRIIQETFDELSLEAHPTKSVNLVCGSKDWVEKTKKELMEDPAQIQGFKVKVAENEKYLGMKLVSGDIKAIIDANIRMKAGKVHQVATKIRNDVRDPRMMRIGALKAAATQIQAEVIPVLLYGCEAWLRVSKAQYKAMEDILKEAIVRILSLPGTTTYEALLLEVSNFHIEQWMDCMKLNYFMKKLHVKKRGKLYRALREDIMNNDERGFIGDIRELCVKYGLPDITLTPVRPEYIKYKCKETSRRRAMMVTLARKKIPPMLVMGKIFNDHYTFPIMESRAITTLRTGNLIFKNWCPNRINLRNAGDKKCMFPACQEDDTLKHVLECEFYSTKFTEGSEGPTKDWAKYLVELDKERISKFHQPLILCDGWSRTE